jgi:hypothetical protein
LITVPHGFDQKIAEQAAVELKFSKNVEDLPA